jgi:Zn-finger nucleic acid-binding protein
MLCPNDQMEMQPVKVISHYGQPVILDQCKSCGGIWFDSLELYSAKPGEAEKIELLDSAALQSPSRIENLILVCPRDGSQLSLFLDKNFPREIIVERCPACSGMWLNRGEFGKYQKARQELRARYEKGPGDQKLKEDIERIISNQAAGSDDTLGRLGRFLSTPIDTRTQTSSSGENTAGTIISVLSLILRLFIFK